LSYTHHSDQIHCVLCPYVGDSTGFGQHTKQKHGLTHKEYAWKCHTDEIVVCAWCHKEYFRRFHHQRANDRGKFCSIGCASSFHHHQSGLLHPIKEKANCIICGNKFEKFIRGQRNNVRCCSRKCASVYREQKFSKEQKSIRFWNGQHKKEQDPNYWKSVTEQGKKYSQWMKDHEEIVYERAHRAVLTKIKNGTTNSNTPESAIKCHETKKKNGSYVVANTKRHNTMLDKPGGYSESVLKCHETKKKIGSYSTISRVELALGWFLCFKFGHDNVFQQIKIGLQECSNLFGEEAFADYNKSFTFDYVIKHNNQMFGICLDGVYFHGLDKPITEIAKCRTRTDKTIFNTYYRDRYFDNFIRKTNLNVIRITDIDFIRFVTKSKQFVPYYTNGLSTHIDSFLFAVNPM
jgi:hypothetical protein